MEATGQPGLTDLLQRKDWPAPLQVPKKIIIPFHSEILLLGIYPKKERAVSTSHRRVIYKVTNTGRFKWPVRAAS